MLHSAAQAAIRASMTNPLFSSTRLSEEPKSSSRSKTGGLGNLTDRYVRFVHREGGRIPQAACAPLIITAELSCR